MLELEVALRACVIELNETETIINISKPSKLTSYDLQLPSQRPDEWRDVDKHLLDPVLDRHGFVFATERERLIDIEDPYAGKCHLDSNTWTINASDSLSLGATR